MTLIMPRARFYIVSSNTGFSLRAFTELKGSNVDDVHIINLGLALRTAKVSAKTIVNKIVSLLNQDLMKIELEDAIRSSTRSSKLKSSLNSNHDIDLLELDLMPYGAHKGEPVEGVGSAYLSSCITQVSKTPQADAKKLAACALGVLALRGDLTEEDVCTFFLRNALAKKEMNKSSEFIGTVKDRLEFNAIIEFEKSEMNDHRGRMQYFYKLRFGNDSMLYSGSTKLASKGGIVRFKATVKEHHLFKGIKTTVVERPRII